MLITAIISFISTNIDDIFILMIFFAQSETLREKIHITFGQYMGIGLLMLLSLSASFLLQNIPSEFIALLGFIPIALGIKEWIFWQKEKSGPSLPEETVPELQRARSLIFHVMLITLANGADNLGLYIPLFTGYSAIQMLLVALTFSIMTALWCFLAHKLASLPVLKAGIQKYRPILVPVVFIGLGIFIILENTLL